MFDLDGLIKYCKFVYIVILVCAGDISWSGEILKEKIKEKNDDKIL